MKIIWLHEIVKPPVKQGGEDEPKHSGEAQRSQKRTIPIKVIYPCEVGAQCKYQKNTSADPPKPSRVKRMRTWIKRNFFNAMLTLFTAMYAIGFLFDAYVTKRAYIARGEPGKRAMKVLPGDVGVEVDFYNIGQTPIKKYVTQGWLLKEKEVVSIEAPSPHALKSSLAPRYSFQVSMRWPDAPTDLPRIRNNEIGVSILLRIYYQDAFYIWHCEQFTHHYDTRPDGGFTLTGGPSVCDTSVTHMRFNRVCVPSADKTYGAWVETWEDFNAMPVDPSPENDPTPCQNKK